MFPLSFPFYYTFFIPLVKYSEQENKLLPLIEAD